MTDQEQQPAALVENMLLLRREDFDELLDRAAERGAAYDNLVGKTPTNADAAAAGWRRVATLDAARGDTTTSYLFHKVTGDLPPGFGERMPLRRAKLDEALIAVIRRWIDAGAPVDGWVPGTD